MGCPVHHEIWNETGDLYDRLEKDGIIHDGMLDYGRCDLTTLEELVQDHLNDDKDHGKPKEDYRLMSVYRTDEGGVIWVLNYHADDMPSVAISRHFPNETMEYKEYGDSCMNQGRASVYCHCILKNNKVVRDFVKEERERRELEEQKHEEAVKKRFKYLKDGIESTSLEDIANHMLLKDLALDDLTMYDIVRLYSALTYVSGYDFLHDKINAFGEELIDEELHEEVEARKPKPAPCRINIKAPF